MHPVLSGVGTNAEVLTATGCLVVSYAVGYATYWLIRTRYRRELPGWTLPFLSLVFITSGLVCGIVADQFGLWGSTVPSIP
jgi:amino acid transporter